MIKNIAKSQIGMDIDNRENSFYLTACRLLWQLVITSLIQIKPPPWFKYWEKCSSVLHLVKILLIIK